MLNLKSMGRPENSERLQGIEMIYLESNKKMQVLMMNQDCDPVFARVDNLLALLNKSKSLHILLVLSLKDGPMRFSSIKRHVNSSSTTVTRRLGELEESGLVERAVQPTTPSFVAYRLTEEARLLAPSIQSMYDWVVKCDPKAVV